MAEKQGRKDCMRDHCWEEQLPLDLFLSFIEIRSFIFPEIEIHVGSDTEPRRSNVCLAFCMTFEHYRILVKRT